ncbi:acetolactate synthase small subunit [Sediminitomix flava]|uniref:Acetolactate synthase small subunit n=1 Tax=Sediminitomix flava TaxID=379075 RepID=A0A315Z6M2_SEDFL|nr:acetolactate synthase small subunit [Sediminitomix flava]PWJ40068.1 acetolactate synthase small subunit [Sediminitomix flava]
MKEKFTLSIYTENTVGLTSRITNIFSRRKTNIESLTTSASELEHVHKFTVVFFETEEGAEKIMKQVERQIDVIKAFSYRDQEIIHQEIALYKVAFESLSQEEEVEKIVRRHHARILSATPEYVVIEKTGHEWETHELYEDLKPIGLMQFARSGRVSISKERQDVSPLLQEFSEFQESL